MRVRNVPPVNARYWTTIIFASMCGANAGDFFSSYLKFGNLSGILPLLAAFLCIAWAEKKSTATTEAFYWLAIIVLRTMATNLADFTTQNLRLGHPLTEIGLAILLAAIVAADPDSRARGPRRIAGGVPQTGWMYWAAMLVAGTLGTAAGDYTQGHAGLALGSGPGSLVTMAGFLVVLAAALGIGGMAKPWYWAAIVAARTTGTDLGDFLAGRNGLKLGLPLSLACTSLLLVLVVALWKTPPAASPAMPPAGD